MSSWTDEILRDREIERAKGGRPDAFITLSILEYTKGKSINQKLDIPCNYVKQQERKPK